MFSDDACSTASLDGALTEAGSGSGWPRRGRWKRWKEHVGVKGVQGRVDRGVARAPRCTTSLGPGLRRSAAKQGRDISGGRWAWHRRHTRHDRYARASQRCALSPASGNPRLTVVEALAGHVRRKLGARSAA